MDITSFGKSESMQDSFSDCPKKQFEKLFYIRTARHNLCGRAPE
ncbi:Uncharacterized protein dnm_056880 [Desulfonema magnum]|uniref:Uncharacterized protein n=1 Tax=Desulfonema magnum TaxID=45655 RepID=A0A975BQ47_9BACT|nr:Uncharacterized protein dnm_056880 [Desulfonema magnum]